MSEPTGEFALINWIRQQQSSSSPQITLGPGDDTAALKWQGDGECLITTDMLLEGSCFLMDAGARRIGRKAMAVNLSDIAAMAGQPLAAVVSCGLPRTSGRALAEELYHGMSEMAEEFETNIIGGDTNTWDGPLTLSITLIGQATGTGPVKRRGAKINDWIFVTGSLGGSILGHHLDFKPRVREAQQMHQSVELHSMIDISDGLAQDLHHICEESQCGAVLIAEQIPIHDSAHKLNDGQPPLQHALSDGEDFELVFTVSPEDGQRLLQIQPIDGITLHHIGKILDKGYWLEQDSQRRQLEPKGYSHSLD